MNNDIPNIPFYVAHPQSVWFEEHWRPIIEKLQAENERLKEVISYLPKVPTQPYEKEMAQKIIELEAENTKLRNAVDLCDKQIRELEKDKKDFSDWADDLGRIVRENEQLKKDLFFKTETADNRLDTIMGSDKELKKALAIIEKYEQTIDELDKQGMTIAMQTKAAVRKLKGESRTMYNWVTATITAALFVLIIVSAIQLLLLMARLGLIT